MEWTETVNGMKVVRGNHIFKQPIKPSSKKPWFPRPNGRSTERIGVKSTG